MSEIRWSAHLANKKASWYRFHVPLDISEAAALTPEQRGRRNADVVGAERRKLVIDLGIRTIRASLHDLVTFDTGTITGREVPLGRISTESTGHLLVVGGNGKSASYATPEKPITGVAHNDAWYDDVSDGWWYTALLPSRRRLVSCFTDPGLFTPTDFRRSLLTTRYVAPAAHPHGLDTLSPPRRAPAHSAHLDRLHGDGWIAAGDAAVAFDPCPPRASSPPSMPDSARARRSTPACGVPQAPSTPTQPGSALPESPTITPTGRPTPKKPAGPTTLSGRGDKERQKGKGVRFPEIRGVVTAGQVELDREES